VSWCRQSDALNVAKASGLSAERVKDDDDQDVGIASSLKQRDAVVLVGLAAFH
jgi:hypothetical protein